MTEHTSSFPHWHGTTILTVRKGGINVLYLDGSVAFARGYRRGTSTPKMLGE